MSSTSSAGSYRAVLTIPHAAATLGAALTGRLAFGVLPLALLFTVQEATGSFTTAGAAVACFGLSSILMPFKARVIDRFGPARTLPVLATATAAPLAALALLAWSGVTASAPYLLLSLFFGVCAPPLGPVMRMLWRTLTEDTALLERAYSLDSACEEALYLAGPVTTGAIVATAFPAAALLAAAGLLFGGTLALCATPVVRSTRTAVSAEPLSWSLGPLRSRRFSALATIILITAAGTGIAVTTVAARAQEHGNPGAAGYLEAALAAGSVLGGLAWGQRKHKRPASTQLTGLILVLAAGIALAATAENLVVLGIVMAAAGLAVVPLFIVSYLASDKLVPEHQRTEASTWVNTANNLGTAAGSTTAGLLVDHGTTTSTFLTGAVILGVAAAMAKPLLR